MCCQGWLTGEAWGHRFSPGKPCGWLGGSGCTIYEHRPANPCQSFLCEWKRQPAIPDSLRPDRAGVIMVARVQDAHQYVLVIESRGSVSDLVHTWARTYSNAQVVNIVVPAAGGVRVYSRDPKFHDVIGQVYTVITG